MSKILIISGMLVSILFPFYANGDDVYKKLICKPKTVFSKTYLRAYEVNIYNEVKIGDDVFYKLSFDNNKSQFVSKENFHSDYECIENNLKEGE